MLDYTYDQIAKMIDHSLLQPYLTREELERGIQVALDYDVATVCILPYYLRPCVERLAGSAVLPTTTVGFPHGAHATAIKVAEARQALADGARELDMVVNISAVKSGDWDYVRRDIGEVLATTRAAGGRLKVIFENCYLNEAEKIRLCEICGELRVDWVKTSTGYGSAGATEEDVALMRRHSPPEVQVKAAGGVRSFDALLRMRALGATRIGATRTAAILEECRLRLGLAPIRPEFVPA